MNKIYHDSEVPAHSKQVITACAFIHHRFDNLDRVFLAKRAITKKFLPGLLELPGGHIDFGEDIVEGLKREIVEELGMRISVGDPFAVFTYLNEIKGSHSIEVVYFAKFIDPLANIKLHSQDHSEYTWLAQSALPSCVDSISEAEFKNIQNGFEILSGKPYLLASL